MGRRRVGADGPPDPPSRAQMCRPNTPSGRRCAASAVGANGLACRPGSVRPEGGRGDHPSTTAVADSLQRSTRALGRAALGRARVRCPEAPDFLTLLQVGFAEPTRSPGSLVVSCTTVSPLPPPAGARGGGLFSVALSRGLPRVGVTHHLALWSPDLPRPSERGTRSPGQPVRAPSIGQHRPVRWNPERPARCWRRTWTTPSPSCPPPPLVFPARAPRRPSAPRTTCSSGGRRARPRRCWSRRARAGARATPGCGCCGPGPT